MSGYGEQWPEKGPNVELHVNVSSGTLSLTGTNKVTNYSDFDFTAPNLRGLVFVNGSYQDELAIASATGAITLSSFSVSTDDIVEFRFRLVGTVSDPWTTRLQLDRTLRLEVPAGTSTTDYDSSNHVMPVPSIDLTFGWDGSDKLKLGFKVNGDDGASQDATVATRLSTCPDKTSSSTLDLDSSSTQTHVSTFTQWEGADQALLSYHLKSSTAETRVEDRWQIIVCDRLSVPGYPGGFPTSGVRLKQRSVSGALKLER
jgi:hypothetical protein